MDLYPDRKSLGDGSVGRHRFVYQRPNLCVAVNLAADIAAKHFWPMATCFPPPENHLSARVKEIGWIDVSRRVWSLDRDELEAVCLCRLGNDDFGWAFEERSTGRKIAVEQGSLPRFHRDRCTTWSAWILAGFIASSEGLLVYIMDGRGIRLFLDLGKSVAISITW